ncbi:MAG TPA: ATP-binding protein [Bryobacteraceae bacterium]|nr:ATP-binding protein [Bryobacteraceae bacterium]
MSGIFLKVILGVICILLIAVVTVDYFASQVAGEIYMQSLQQQLADKGRMLALNYPEPDAFTQAAVSAIAKTVGDRVTVIRSDGQVVADSGADAGAMDNHRTRPELVQAFSGKTGSSVRKSVTLRISFLYVAVPIQNGAIRIAVPVSEIDRQVRAVRVKILAGTGLAFLPAMVLAAFLARWISRRFDKVMLHASQLAKGNFRSRLPHTGGAEFGRLARTLNETAANLQQATEQLEREHVELQKVERIRKDFVINVSHELRTPLASIQGYTETLMDGALHDPEYNMKFLRIIRHNAERLARLTEDLLTLSRIEQKRQKFEFDLHYVNALLKDAVELVRPIAEKNHIRIAEELAHPDAETWCDSEAVSQIMSNLLDNAIKYTPAGGSITVGARPTGRHYEFYVRDTGSGIAAEELPRLFERFYRVDKARSRELGGTGLGLAIVKHLVAAHNGVARVESQVNEGSTFFFTLPMDESALSRERLNPEFTAS